MTEAEWLECEDPERMLWFLCGRPQGIAWTYEGHPASRKWFLLAAACCRRVWSKLTEPQCRDVVEAAEAHADGALSAAELRAVGDAAVNCGYIVHHDPQRHRAYAATDALGRRVGFDSTRVYDCHNTVGHSAYAADDRPTELLAQCILTRDIFGNPFHPVTFPPEWRTDTAVALGQQMYESRDFSAMPILADALQDAGCDNDDILSHCRGDGPHVRGCWVVDLVLGKQ